MRAKEDENLEVKYSERLFQKSTQSFYSLGKNLILIFKSIKT
jgi:hypothetical protein